MARRREAKRLQEERQRQRIAEEEAERREEREQKEAEEREEEERRRVHERASEEQEKAQRADEAKAKKDKKRVMKREAVDLVKTLVTQQLNEKLRDHDDQMMELQRMVARLQDVIRQQNVLIQQSTDDMLEQHQQQTTAISSHTKHRLLKPSPSSVTIHKPAAAESLPLIQQRPVAVTTPVAGSRPSGIKPPRQFERTTKLPLLASPSATTSFKR